MEGGSWINEEVILLRQLKVCRRKIALPKTENILLFWWMIENDSDGHKTELVIFLQRWGIGTSCGKGKIFNPLWRNSEFQWPSLARGSPIAVLGLISPIRSFLISIYMVFILDFILGFYFLGFVFIFKPIAYHTSRIKRISSGHWKHSGWIEIIVF